MSTQREKRSPQALPSPEQIASAQRTALLDLDRQHRDYLARQAAAEIAGIPALERLVRVAQGGSGQCHHVRRFLLGLYNSYAWPFELNRLRALDAELQADALAVLRMDLTPRKEIHLFLEDGEKLFRTFWEMEAPAGDQDFDDDVPY